MLESGELGLKSLMQLHGQWPTSLTACIGDSREANSPEVTAWGRTSSSFLAVVRHIVIGLEAALPKIYTTINQHRQLPLIFNVKGGDVVD